MKFSRVRRGRWSSCVVDDLFAPATSCINKQRLQYYVPQFSQQGMLPDLDQSGAYVRGAFQSLAVLCRLSVLATGNHCLTHNRWTYRWLANKGKPDCTHHKGSEGQWGCAQDCLRKVIKGVGGLSHVAWRTFQDEHTKMPSQNFVDGDLIEQFLDLKRESMERVARDMGEGVTSEELLRMVEELSRSCH